MRNYNMIKKKKEKGKNIDNPNNMNIVIVEAYLCYFRMM